MSGGVWEYMMAVMLDENGNPVSGSNSSYHSGFTGLFGEGGSLVAGYSWPEEKYYDKYAYGTNYSEYTRRILGDATGEMGPFQNVTTSNFLRQNSSWYGEWAWLPSNSKPWIDRGGSYDYGSECGIFNFAADAGGTNPYIGFRIVLTP